jgi:uncharacterized protein
MPTIDQARAWYDETDPVHGFDHVLRVLKIAEQIGSPLEADLDILRAAVLLHDATSAHPSDPGGREEHEQRSARFARKVLEAEGWEQERIAAVLHCIRAHRFRGSEQPQSLEARILFDADKLDVLGAFGIARTIGYAIQAGQPVYAAPSEKFLATGEKEHTEPHSAYHEYLFKLRNIRDRLHTDLAHAIADKRIKLMDKFFEALADEDAGLD